MRHVSLLWMAGLLLVSGPALAKKKKKDAAEAVEVTTQGPVPQAPGDAASQQFAQKLVTLEITGFLPLSGGSGTRFVHETLRFAPDNTWAAKGFIEVDGERLDCQESGTWSLEPATSPTEATMTWKVASTNCVNQQPDTERRYLVTIEGGNIRVAYR